MYLEEHEESCREQMGRPHTVAHLFLDQFFRYIDSKYERHNAPFHRHILHHKKGIELIAVLFGTEKAEAARLHILDDQSMDGYKSTIPESWDDFPIWGYLAKKIKEELKTHWRKMARLHDRFTVVILGDTYGAITKPVKKVLREANLVIVTGQYWNENDTNLTKKKALETLYKYGVAIVLLENPGRWKSLRIRNHRFYLEKSACDSVKNEVKFLIDAPNPEGASLEWEEDCLRICPGYAGPDSSKEASLIRIDSYGPQWQDANRDLYISCLRFKSDIGTWVYGEFFTPERLQLGAWNGVRISELPLEEQVEFKSFLRGAQVPCFYPDEKENFAYASDYIRYRVQSEKD